MKSVFPYVALKVIGLNDTAMDKFVVRVILSHLIGLQIQFMLFEDPGSHYELYSEQWLVGLLRLQ
ncbi:hypothetical protein RHGRI_001604 [Rhododendron griersonianum]|uniref:Uncharacterized protein n=1 Tax=Rhododendron griersonianum TaxID=479676 RepID=A0AAV6LKT2_9ERIC|nr:hypothetical protein RHGRI_001604 [Rhododendron griersonianum]